MSGLKRFFKKFFQESFDIQHRLLNIILLSGMLGIVLSCISSIFLGFDPFSYLLIGICLVFFVFTLWVANGLKKPQLAVIILSIITNNIILPLLYLYSGGMKSGIPIWCLMGLIFSVMLLKGKKAYIILSINLLGFLTAVFISYKFPQFLITIDSIKFIYIDMVIAVVMVASIFTLIFKYQAYVYEKQKKEILNAYKEAQKATNAKSEFLSKISHDIRTPVNAVVGYTEIAKRNINDKEKLKDAFNKISIASNHLLNLIDEVLDMSKIESGKAYKIEEEVCHLSDLVDEVTRLMQKEISDKNLKVHTNFSLMDDGVVSCDRLHLSQILLNLLCNAIKYSYPEKNIFIDVVQFTSDDESNSIYEFHVKDEGCGINQDYLDKIFIPFEREKNALNNAVAGTGLGLAITKSLVEMLHGTIEVSSELGKGTEFVVTLPLAVPDLTELEEDEDTMVYDFHGKRILIVDDDDMSREITCDALKEVGAEVEEARDGSFAIEKINISTPGFYDLVIMDVHMPVIDGCEATKIIRGLKTKELAEIPIIAMTANAFPEDKKRAFNSGVNAYLIKPVRINDLVKVLKLILHDRR
ncbi:MAG: ATP-binding protein [Treponema sp.]|nr:ATP-binding protein [Treponema sp.]